MMKLLAFESFCNAYAGQECFVVGRGPSRYDYSDLKSVRCPIFFINDAVALEEFAELPSFFFAHDRGMLRWLKHGIKSTAVLPEDGKGKILRGVGDPVLSTASCSVVLYKWRRMERQELLGQSRESVSKLRELYENFGTIHSLLHFVWYCGFSNVTFIGCDGTANRLAPYDSRIPNLSRSSPFWNYRKIFSIQEDLCRRFQLKRRYLGTPEGPTPTRNEHISKVIHFIWFKEIISEFALKMIDRAQKLHPGWDVKVWREFPRDFPIETLHLAKSLPFFCQREDILRVWLLLKHGGIYLDTDIYLLRSLDDLRYFDHFFVYQKIDGNKVSTGAIGGSKGHPFFEKLWDDVLSRLSHSAERTTFGAQALTRFCNSRRTNILPAHYFYIFTKPSTVLNFVRLPAPEQRIVIERHRDRMRDAVMPYGVHSWGIPASEMPEGIGASNDAPRPVISEPEASLSWNWTGPKQRPKGSRTIPEPAEISLQNGDMGATKGNEKDGREPTTGLAIAAQISTEKRKGKKRKLIFKNFQSPGDIVMLTAAVRDIHRCYPNQFTTDVRTSSPALWENNPFITPLDQRDDSVEVIECHYPLIHRSNTGPWHFIHGFIEFLNETLNLEIRATDFKGYIRLASEEKVSISQVRETTKKAVPYWIIAAGGKRDFTIKWWARERFQAVVNHFRERILFVQVGEAGHEHPALEGVLDLRGKTDLRQLVRLVHHSQGVVCPVTLLMHLAAAVETREGMPLNRPCVVVAGGREPSQWEAYPHHQFIHTNGALLCCDNGGCWKSRVVPLGDGDEKDREENLCVDVVVPNGAGHPSPRGGPRAGNPSSKNGNQPKNALGFPKDQWNLLMPKCMDIIGSNDVIRGIEMYFNGGSLRYLKKEQIAACKRTMPALGWSSWESRAPRPT